MTKAWTCYDIHKLFFCHFTCTCILCIVVNYHSSVANFSMQLCNSHSNNNENPEHLVPTRNEEKLLKLEDKVHVDNKKSRFNEANSIRWKPYPEGYAGCSEQKLMFQGKFDNVHKMELGLSDNYEAISFNIGYTMQSGRDGSGPASSDNHPGEVFGLSNP